MEDSNISDIFRLGMSRYINKLQGDIIMLGEMNEFSLNNIQLLQQKHTLKIEKEKEEKKIKEETIGI